MAAERKRWDLEAEQPDIGKSAAPLDGGLLRQALGEAHAAQSTQAGARGLDVRGLHEHAEAAFSASAEHAALEAEPAWSLRRQFLFIAFASALCWAVVLAPLALVF